MQILCAGGLIVHCVASVAQLGERQTEDLKVPGSIPGRGTFTGRRSLSPVVRLNCARIDNAAC